MPVVSVGASIGGELHTYAVEDGDTIGDIFEKANITLSRTTEIIERQTGDSVSADDKPVANHIYYISEKFKSQALGF